MEKIIANLKDEAQRSWPGEVGASRAAQIETFLRDMLANYSQITGISQPELLVALENQRKSSVCSYYQLSKFPKLTEVTVLKDLAEFKQRYPSGRYTCPLCGGASTDPYECNTGRDVGHGTEKQVCNWKAYGLFGTAGKGLKIVLLDRFLENPQVHEIFMPVEVEMQEKAA